MIVKSASGLVDYVQRTNLHFGCTALLVYYG